MLGASLHDELTCMAIAQVHNEDEMAAILEMGTLCRATGSTNMNSRYAHFFESHFLRKTYIYGV